MLAQEGNRGQWTLFSYFKDYAPADIRLSRYASRLPYDEIYDVIRDAEPIGRPIRLVSRKCPALL